MQCLMHHLIQRVQLLLDGRAFKVEKGRFVYYSVRVYKSIEIKLFLDHKLTFKDRQTDRHK